MHIVIPILDTKKNESTLHLSTLLMPRTMTQALEIVPLNQITTLTRNTGTGFLECLFSFKAPSSGRKSEYQAHQLRTRAITVS